MKEIYSWVPWFSELCQKIADNDSEYLAEKAREIPWKRDGTDPGLVQYGNENIDPFSFVYTLAGYQTSKTRIYPRINEVFDLRSELPLDVEEAFIFPTPILVNTLFHSGGKGDPELLWRLFRNAVKGIDAVSAEDFEAAQRINGVKAPSLTQTLFLINAYEFLPFDNSSQPLMREKDRPADSITFDAYRSFIERTAGSFPGCSLFEINVLFYLSNNKNEKDRLQINPGNIWQISSLAYGADREDCWYQFEEENCAFTGGTGKVGWPEYDPTSDELLYQLDKPQKGDVILARKGGIGRGVGVIYRNDYAYEISADARIHVIWICKQDKNLGGKWSRFKAFTRANTIADDFRAAYPEAFEFLDRFRVAPRPPPKTQSIQHGLNTILYGPPGTGKTYATMSRSVEICDGVQLDGEELRNRYVELAEQGRIVFITFHQSYGYEEFIEGIRPLEKDGEVVYEVQDGVLKRLAISAKPLFDFELLWSEFLENARKEPLFITKEKNKKCTLDFEDESAVTLQEEDSGRRHRITQKQVEELWESGLRTDPNEVTVTEIGSRAGLVSGAASYLWVIYRELWNLSMEVRNRSGTLNGGKKNFVLVIDEINRANISKVLGELITLLEEDKRAGANNELTVTLPYSKQTFVLPSNLYILGTMNTADRSIALLDTALRRRFRFEEIPPDPSLLAEAAARSEVDLQSVLTLINERLEYFVDRDHLIGHAWLMGVENRTELDEVMRHKIIPLIAEYFYDDWRKVQAVLGATDAFITKKRLDAPPGLEPEFEEERHQWSIQAEFHADAYEQLLHGVTKATDEVS